MARTSRSIGKNHWALFLLILLGIVAGSLLGHLASEVKFLEWLDYGFYFSIGDNNTSGVVTLNLGAVVINFGLKLKITIASVIGAVISIFIYRKL